MERFVFRIFCVFYLAMVVNTRTINNSNNIGDIFGINDEKEHINDDKVHMKDEREDTTTEMDKILASITEKIDNLKNAYGGERFKALLPQLEQIIYEYPRKTTSKTTVTEDLDFIGTAQIEALLNDIKARAIQMVAEQNPSVTDMISNTVTEATFEADPILTHLEIASPGYALTTFVCLNNIENIDKRTANESNYVVVSGEDSKHSVTVRSVKESAYTIAQSVEDMLQKELKCIYKKVKQKVSKDFHKEIKAAKTTLQHHTSKVTDRITKVGSNKSHLTTLRRTTKSRKNRGNKDTKTTSAKEEDTTVIPTIDDFAMLTLYEQILAKTHEDNVMKMLATNKKRKIEETIKLSKRNPETLTDLTLKKDMKRMLDDGDNIPDIDYNNDNTLPQSTNDYPSNPIPAKKLSDQDNTESTPIEDTSYEGLSDKLAYKDYVNGFKNYLKFQRDEAKENFSALIKYQAHKHHNVDDIGKFILNKIPQIPKRQRRHFFDENDIDDQDISTKSDDSWFKKHFYMFIDNGPPKKFHTSETVEFRDVTEANKIDYPDVIEKPDSQAYRHFKTDKDSSGNINLDELSRLLEDRKKFTSISPYFDDGNIVSTSEAKINNIEESSIGFRVTAPNIISKFFRKRQKGPDIDKKNTHETESNKDHTFKYEDEGQGDDDDNFLFNTDLARFQRNAVKEKSAEEESSETHTTFLNKQSTKTNIAKSSDEKVGCVSIVTQPTAIVNLHKSNAKVSKVQRLLSKLHIRRKKNHKKKKEKRHCTRVQRFNLLQKLKDMFTSKHNTKNFVLNEDPDYEMIKAHIDTFKPVKYYKIASLDELKNQIPNITSDMEIQFEIVKDDDEWTARDDTTKINKATENTNVASNEYTLPNVTTHKSKSEHTSKLKHKSKMKQNILPTDNIMNVNVKTFSKMGDVFAISPVTIDNIRSELDKLQLKISTEANLKDSQTSPNSVTEPRREGREGLNEDDKESDDDITIKAKLTRLAKYPIPKFKHNTKNVKPIGIGDISKLYEFSDNESYLNVHKEPFPFAETEETATISQHYNKLKKYDVTLSAITETTPKILDDEKLKELVGNHRTYPDYFHDLVRWNNDILNNDKVSNPTWQDILHNIQGAQQYTTPDVYWISKELADIKENLNHYNIGKQTKIAEQDPLIKNDIITGIGSFMKHPKNTAKAKDIKLQVGNSKNKQTIGDSEDSKNDPKSYSNYKTQDIINVLNDLYTKYNGIKKGNTKFKNNEVPGAPVHTNNSNAAVQAMFTPSHEDKLYFMANSSSWIPKKISKNSLTVPSPKQKQTRPIAHVNEMPKQFYNTPLPMKNENFEQFLKDNQLDVETLTSPLTNMPAATETWYSKMHSLTKIMSVNNVTGNDDTKEKSKLTESVQTTTKMYEDNTNDIAYKLYPESQIEYLNDLERDLMDDNENRNARNKRYNVHDYNSYIDSAVFGTEKIRDSKSKFSNLFDKKPEDKESVIVNSVTDGSNDDLEITIINFEDLDNSSTTKELFTTTDSQVFTKVNSATKKLAKIDALSTTKAKNTKTKKYKEKLHKTSYSSLKADGIGTNIYDSTEITKEKQHQTQIPLKTDEKETYDALLTKVPYLPAVTTMNHAKLPSVLKNKDKHAKPKRVRISSHSYSYDVVYNVPSKTDRGDIARDEPDILNPSLANTKMSRNIFRYGVTDPKLRAARSAKTTSKRRTFSQTIHFTKQMKKARDRRLFKIIPIFKDKLKSLAKKKSFTALFQSTANKTATRFLNLNATDMKTSTTATNVTKRSERNSMLTYNFDDMFDLKVFTVNGKRNAGIENNASTTSRTNRHTSKVYVTNNNKTSDYVEGNMNYDVVYYELETMKPPKNLTTAVTKNPIDSSNQEVNAYNKPKRDVDSGFYTAKDVAELEVIVDLIRNTLRYAEKSPTKMTTLHNLWSVKRSKTSMKANTDRTTNFIQVHIAVPYDIYNRKRNSDPAKVRKVFTAKLAKPVDLEYQIHSIEDNTATTVNAAHYGLSPGTYLIVDDDNKNYTFKAVEFPFSQMKEDDVEQTADETKSNKMELNREEFIAAVQKYLAELYENVTTNSNQNQVDRRARDTSWNKIKKYFAHDRVCNCKCKANKPMCSSCAACDPVIKELILEFDNLAKYMSDHCTEIQTFFWMNPSGGRALRDTVHKIDKSLNDYYKRVKGKCNGSKCKTFATYIDKRGSKNKKINHNYIGEPLLNDIKSLKDHFESAKFIPYDETLREVGDEFVNAVSNCISTNPLVKRRNSNKRKCYNKDVYTLDNISVNIICTTDAHHDSTTNPVTSNSNMIARMSAVSKDKLPDFDLNKANCKTYKTELDEQFKPMLQKLFKYDTETEVNVIKREAKSNQIESPLIADTGGSFWREYINKGNAEQNNEYKTSDEELSIVQTNSEKIPKIITTKLAFKDKLKNIRKSKMKSDRTTNTLVTDISTDLFSYNINELFKLINTIKEDTENEFAITIPTILGHRNYTTRTKKIKTKKNKKLHKTGKAKMHRKHKTKTLKILHEDTNHRASSSHDKTKSNEMTTAIVPKTEKAYASNFIEETTTQYKDTDNLTTEKNTLKSTTTKINLYEKIKKATMGFRSYIGYRVHDTTLAEKDKKRINTNAKDDKKAGKSEKNVISGPTTKLNPTLLIINDDNTNRDVKDKSKIKSFFLSLLNYESSKIDKEKGRLKDEIEKEMTDAEAAQKFSHGNVDDIEQTQPKNFRRYESQKSHSLEEATLIQHSNPLKYESASRTPELDYGMMQSVQGMEPEVMPTPPGRQARPGILERVALRLGVKAGNDKVAATSTRHLKPIHHHHHAKTKPTSKIISEEIEPAESMKLLSNDPNSRIGSKSQTESDYSTDRSETKQEIKDSIRTAVGKSRNMNKISEFDSYVRENNGIYRLRKRRHQSDSTNVVTGKYGSGFRKITQKYKNDRFRHRKKQKRSNTEVNNSQRLSAWLQHSAGYFVATITSFYIVLATFAAVVNWVFGR